LIESVQYHHLPLYPIFQLATPLFLKFNLSIMSSSDSALQEAVSAMGLHFYDVTIICTTDDHQAEYWMDVLGSGLLSSKKVLAVSEDWNASGGAGNGLGTLYAWKKACALAASKYNFDLATELAAGDVSAALYHTAGKGTRMAPLPASENNNKPGVVRIDWTSFFIE
jgi:hypothetical protein